MLCAGVETVFDLLEMEDDARRELLQVGPWAASPLRDRAASPCAGRRAATLHACDSGELACCALVCRSRLHTGRRQPTLHLPLPPDPRAPCR